MRNWALLILVSSAFLPVSLVGCESQSSTVVARDDMESYPAPRGGCSHDSVISDLDTAYARLRDVSNKKGSVPEDLFMAPEVQPAGFAGVQFHHPTKSPEGKADCIGYWSATPEQLARYPKLTTLSKGSEYDRIPIRGVQMNTREAISIYHLYSDGSIAWADRKDCLQIMDHEYGYADRSLLFPRVRDLVPVPQMIPRGYELLPFWTNSFNPDADVASLVRTATPSLD